MTKLSIQDYEEYSRIIDEGTKEYFAWLRHILTLSAGSLTILVALQNQFLPAAPKVLFLLKLSWILFAVSIILALFALAGHHLLLFHTAQDYLKLATRHETSAAGHTSVPEPYKKLGRIVPYFFVSAVVALTLFGIANLTLQNKTIPAIEKKQGTIQGHQNNKENDSHHPQQVYQKDKK